MQFERELLPGVMLFTLKQLKDTRGHFVKTYTRSLFDSLGIEFDFREEFYSMSHKDVIRGMHFQLPPYDHVKFVTCPIGAVLDVLVDLRCGAGQGRIASVVMSADAPMAIMIPKGIAHGFKALCDDSLMVYKTSTEYKPSHDAGIRWDSLGFDWGVQSPVVSVRDAAHPTLDEFVSPFGASL